MTNLIDLLDTLKDHKKLAQAKELIEKGTDVNIKDKLNVTPLHVAAMHGNLEMCKMLLERGAEINVKSSNGNTPLGYAAMHNYIEVVNLLKEYNEKA